MSKMTINKEVTLGSQIGSLEMDENSNVRVTLTGIRGIITLKDLEGLTREARDLDSRLNPRRK